MASIISAGTTSATALNMSADTTGVLQLASNNGTVALTIATTGNIGIGTASTSGAKLTIRGSGTTSATASFEAANTNGNTRFFVRDDGATSFYGSSNAETVTFGADGNVQIGTTTVASASTDVLTVGKNSSANDAKIVVRQFGANTAAGLSIIAADDNGATYNSITSSTNGGTQHWRLGGAAGAAGSLPIFTSGTERMRITSAATGGVTCIRTDTPQSGFAGGGASVLTLQSDANKWGVGPTVTFGNFYVLNSSNVGVALNSGNTSWGAASDERVKDIIEPIGDALQKVKTLRAVIGKYKTDEDGVRRSFLIAQDVLAVLPEAVSAEQDELKTLSLRYTEVVPLLVAAINELSAKVTALENK